MTSKLSYEDVRRLARTWFAEATEKSNRDETEIAAWKKEHSKRTPYSGIGSDGGGDSDDSGGGDCGD